MSSEPTPRPDELCGEPVEEPCARTAPRSSPQRTVADAIAHGLWKLGFRLAFGLYGRALAPLAAALDESGIRVVQTQHETGAAFAALEASLVANRPVAVFTTTGPGISNSLTGLIGAKREGGKVLLLSAMTSASQRGRGAFQETWASTMPPSIYTPGPIFHDVVVLESAEGLELGLRRLAAGFASPGGFVAHLSVPVSVQLEPSRHAVTVSRPSIFPPCCSEEVALRCLRRMESCRSVIWVGYGARHAAVPLLSVAERLRCPVMATPRAKGIFPESHRQYLGVTGLGGGGEPEALLLRNPADVILVVGTRLGEYSSFFSPALRPRHGFVVVDLEPGLACVAYPEVPVEGVASDAAAFLRLLDAQLGSSPVPASTELPVVASREASTRISGLSSYPSYPSDPSYPSYPSDPSDPKDCTHVKGGALHPAVLMESVQRVVVEESDAIVLAEAGNAFAWGSHSLRFQTPGRYRASVGWGSMGHATTGVLGAALASGRKAVALVGDGSMLMQHELLTALNHSIPAVWVVLNDGQYGMVYHGMVAHGMSPVGTRFGRVSFGKLAKALGVRAMAAHDQPTLEAALREALVTEGPYLVDVWIDPEIPPPIITRVDSKSPGPDLTGCRGQRKGVLR